MLDQNTDRMWYVIGAVIVGAAIILLMNGTFPKLFASVGETFNDKVEQTTEVTDGIMPIRNLYTKGSYHYSGVPTMMGWTIGEDPKSIIQANIAVEPNTTYQISYRKVGIAPDMKVFTQSGETTRPVHNRIYTDPVRVRQLGTTDKSTNVDGRETYEQKTGSVTYMFTTTDEEKFVTLTSGNSTPLDGLFEPFDFGFEQIRLVKVVD